MNALIITVDDTVRTTGLDLEQHPTAEVALEIAPGRYQAVIANGVVWLHRMLDAAAEDQREYATVEPLYAIALSEIAALAVDPEAIG